MESIKTRKEKEEKTVANINKLDFDPKHLISKKDFSIIKGKALSDINVDDKQIRDFKIPRFSCGVEQGDAMTLFNLIKNSDTKKVLEIGTHIGYSTTYIASALKNKDGKSLTTIDIKDVNNDVDSGWITYNLSKSPLAMIQELGCEDFTTFVASTSDEYFENNDETFDMIFIDGSHRAKGVYNDISNSLKHLNKNGIIMLHDFFPNCEPMFEEANKVCVGVFIAVQKILNENKNFEVVPLGKLPWKNRLDYHSTTLASFVKRG